MHGTTESTGSTQESSEREMDAALDLLQRNKADWAQLRPEAKATILDDILLRRLPAVADRWVAACVEAKGIDPSSSRVGEEWGGFWSLVRITRLLRNSLLDVAAAGRPKLPRPITTREGGQIVAGVFPLTAYDRMLFPGVTAEVWLDPALSAGEFEEAHAARCRSSSPEGRVVFILGAGNYSMLGPADVLHKMFSEHQVAVFKPNPVNEYLGPLVEEAFRPLVERGVFRVVYGGHVQGAYLTRHEQVDELHLTGSDRTYEAIVFGGGDQGRQRKADRTPLLQKRFTCELGNVSPTIVVPGPWSDADLAYQGEHIASMLTLNAGFNCMSTRVIVQHRTWEHRARLLDEIRRVFAAVPTRRAYYPGAREIHARFLEAHPEAEQYGEASDGRLPWTLIPDVDPASEQEPCFDTEAFCSLFAETALEATSVPDFIDRAVELANERLWGTLSATLLVHPRSLKEPDLAQAVERAVANLRYGTIGVNLWAGMGYSMMTSSWGAFPGHPSHDIQSGHEVVNNALMLPDVQKSVLRAPFAQKFPKAAHFATHRNTAKLLRRLARFELDLSPAKLPGILWAAMLG
jgi:acyl-CoA reductase-like NAD-dependent aldehyde dehydrogenase